MRINCDTEISRTPEVVFPWIANPEKAMKWQPNVKGGEIILDKPGVTGTTFKEVIEEGGGSLEMVGVITGYLKNQMIAFQLESRIHRVEVSYSVEASNKGAKVTVDAKITWKFPMNLLSLIMGGRMKKGIATQMESELLELKRICETG